MDNVFVLCLLLLRTGEKFFSYKMKLRMFYRIFIICK